MKRSSLAVRYGTNWRGGGSGHASMTAHPYVPPVGVTRVDNKIDGQRILIDGKGFF